MALILQEFRPVEVDVWEKDPDRPGYLRRVETRRLRDIQNECEAQIRANIPEDMENVDYWYFGRHDQEGERWPEHYGHLACYAVTGGSEGHYVHVELLSRDRERRITSIFLLKTFARMESALRLANALTVMLGA